MELPSGLRAFLDAAPDDTGAVGPDLAYQQLFVPEQILGQTKSRLVDEGGVHLNMVETYAMTVDNLEPMAKQRRGIGNVQLEMLRFTFMIDELPPGRRYTAVRVRISLTPQARPHLFLPDKETTKADLETTMSSELAVELAHLIEVHQSRSRTSAVKRTVEEPVMTVIDHGAEGFGWTFHAREGAPLFPRRVVTQVLIEVPCGTTALAGTFDSEAMISRRVLSGRGEGKAAPSKPAEPFLINLTEPPLTLPRSG
jgi:hypothetical protein